MHSDAKMLIFFYNITHIIWALPSVFPNWFSTTAASSLSEDSESFWSQSKASPTSSTTGPAINFSIELLF